MVIHEIIESDLYMKNPAVGSGGGGHFTLKFSFWQYAIAKSFDLNFLLVYFIPSESVIGK
jgi:hypothetical protein